jgi:hypothetical protein
MTQFREEVMSDIADERPGFCFPIERFTLFNELRRFICPGVEGKRVQICMEKDQSISNLMYYCSVEISRTEIGNRSGNPS